MNSEAKVISAVCKNKDSGMLFSGDVDGLFTSHRDIWESMKKYYWKYKVVPDISVLEEKHRDFDPEPVTEQTAYYVDELRNDYLASKLRNLMINGTEQLRDKPSAQVLNDLFGQLSSLNKLTDSVRDLDLLDIESAEAHYKAQAERSDKLGGSPGIPTGFASIDSAYHTGMAPGHLIVIIGWPGKGKTWFAANLACRAWSRGFKPMIVSLEMSPENMRDRIYTMLGSGMFKASDFSKGDVDIDTFKSWAKKKFDNKGQFIIVSNEGEGEVTPSMIQSKIDQYKPDLLICDYHQLFDDNKHSRNEVERNKNISREFKRLAMSNAIPVIDITAATADDISDRKVAPIMAQVAWSRAIEYDADMAAAVHKEDESNLIGVFSRKMRHGDDFAFYLDWDINRGLITELHDIDGQTD